MSDPRRWLDKGAGASDLERELLRAGRGVQPPEGEQDRIWSALATQIGTPGAPGGEGGAGAAGAGGAGAAGASTTTAGFAGLAKWVVIGALGAGAVLGTTQLLTSAAPKAAQSSPPVESVAVPQSVPSAVLEPERAPEPERAARTTPVPSSDQNRKPEPSAPIPVASASAQPPASAPATAASDDAPKEDRAARLRRESRMLAQVREALRRGDAAGAMTQLDEIRRAFPEGGLSQEREALTIECLERLGRGAEASTRATAFLRLWPSSPYADVVRAHVR
jgi:hypothetical protein